MFRRRVPLSFLGKAREFLWPRKGFSRIYSYLVQRVLRMPGSAYSLACGFACGVGVSFTPLLGFHMLLAFGLAYFLRGNMLTTFFGTMFGNPWTFPFIFVLLQATGEGLISYFGIANFSELANSDDEYRQYLVHFIPLMVGGMLMFVITWIISFSICYFGVVNWREHRARKRKQREKMEKRT